MNSADRDHLRTVANMKNRCIRLDGLADTDIARINNTAHRRGDRDVSIADQTGLHQCQALAFFYRIADVSVKFNDLAAAAQADIGLVIGRQLQFTIEIQQFGQRM